MKILLTGSTGFTGKCLVSLLKNSGHDIFHLVRDKKGLKNEYVWDFVSPVPEELPSCDVLVHLAAHVDFGKDLEILQYNVNTLSTMHLGAYARVQNAYFIFASMVGVHGSQHAEVGQDTPVNPESHYAVSKYLAEEVIRGLVENYTILRICGIYGLNGPQHLGLNKAISDAVQEKIAPVLKGPGKAKRNYICVSDVAQWILCLVNRYEASKSHRRETLYLAGPEVMAIEEYLEIIVEVLLHGMKLERVAGSEGRDLVVKSSPAPFSQLTFRQYLNSLIHP
ncbi:MAG: NAD-dependent epimerase/dehydratase family protein [Thermodesulfobacteriota bacterium]